MNKQRITPREVTTYEIGWLAGIIDGEGSLSFGKCINKQSRFGYNYYNGLAIINTNEEMLTKAVDIINRLCLNIVGSHKMTPLKKQNKKYNVTNFVKAKEMSEYKPCFQMTLRNKEWTINVLELLIPHLTEKKKKAIALVDILKKRVELNNTAKLNHKIANYTEEETEMYMQIWNNARRD